MRRVAPLLVTSAAATSWALGGCEFRTNPRETEGASEPLEDASTATTSERATTADPSDGEAPIVCTEGDVACGVACANLRWSNEHCGHCGHACGPVGLVGECWEGVCQPTRYCALSEEGHETCAGVCASRGEACVDTGPANPGACGSPSYGLYYELTEGFDCHVGYLGSVSLMGGCNEPIAWDRPGGTTGSSLPGAVSCCCTQP